MLRKDNTKSDFSRIAPSEWIGARDAQHGLDLAVPNKRRETAPEDPPEAHGPRCAATGPGLMLRAGRRGQHGPFGAFCGSNGILGTLPAEHEEGLGRSLLDLGGRRQEDERVVLEGVQVPDRDPKLPSEAFLPQPRPPHWQQLCGWQSPPWLGGASSRPCSYLDPASPAWPGLEDRRTNIISFLLTPQTQSHHPPFRGTGSTAP